MMASPRRPGGGHRRAVRAAQERADGAGPGHDGDPHRRAGGGQPVLLRGADSPGHDVLPAVGRAAVPGRPLSGDGDQSRIGRRDGRAGRPPAMRTLRQRTKARSAARAARRPAAAPGRRRGPGSAPPHRARPAGTTTRAPGRSASSAVDGVRRARRGRRPARRRGGAGGQPRASASRSHRHGQLAVPRRSPASRTRPSSRPARAASSRLPAGARARRGARRRRARRPRAAVLGPRPATSRPASRRRTGRSAAAARRAGRHGHVGTVVRRCVCPSGPRVAAAAWQENWTG